MEVCDSSFGITMFLIPKKAALLTIAPRLFAFPIRSSKIVCSFFCEKEFMISALPNVDHSNLNKGKITYMYQKFLSETKERFKCDVTWWQLKYETTFDNINNIQVKLNEK